MRWIWIDRFEEFVSGTSAIAVKNLSLAEEPFGEHFPGWPVFPAALMLEGLAQTGGILVGEVNDFREKVVLAKIPSAKFEREAHAGETLTYRVTVLNLRTEGASVAGEVWIDNEMIGKAEIFFAHLDQSRSKELFGETNFVFGGEMKYLLGKAKSATRQTQPEGAGNG